MNQRPYRNNKPSAQLHTDPSNDVNNQMYFITMCEQIENDVSRWLLEQIYIRIQCVCTHVLTLLDWSMYQFVDLLYFSH